MSINVLSFELTPDGKELHIHGDSAGLLRLAAALQRLATSDTPGHEHLFTPAWGGNDLSQEAQGGANGDRVIDSVTLHCLPSDP